MTPQQNTTWMVRVRQLLDQGYGTEDIAIKLECDVKHVRNEVQILRETGALKRIYGIGEGE